MNANNAIKQKLSQFNGVNRSEIKKLQFQQSVQYFKLEETATDHEIVDFYEFIFLESGKGWHTVNGLRHPVKPRQIHISFPGQHHIWNATKLSGYRLLLGKAFIQKYFNGVSFLMPSCAPFQVASLEQEIFSAFRTDLQLLLREIDKPERDCDIGKLRMELIFNYISVALMTISEDHKPTNSFSKIHPVLEQLQLTLEKNFKKEKDAGFYSKELFMTTNYLNRLCKQQWGTNIKKIIDDRIVKEALKLLGDNSRQSVKEIALSLGFPNLSNFSRFLKSRTGSSPLQFRNQLRSH